MIYYFGFNLQRAVQTVNFATRFSEITQKLHLLFPAMNQIGWNFECLGRRWQSWRHILDTSRTYGQKLVESIPVMSFFSIVTKKQIKNVPKQLKMFKRNKLFSHNFTAGQRKSSFFVIFFEDLKMLFNKNRFSSKWKFLQFPSWKHFHHSCWSWN